MVRLRRLDAPPKKRIANMNRLRFIMIGGFLGAGKTTTISRLARHYLNQGQRVGLVTNDQAQDLVDTNSLRAQGFCVEEVAGACFCCRFDDLIAKVGRLQTGERPDIILAEPVGSCTDLVATVVQPLRDLYGERLEVAPYPVLFKPSHGFDILKREPELGFSPKAAYIFRKQLEEADAIVINRIDEISPSVLSELNDLVAEEYAGVPVLRMSAKTGQGFEALTELLDQNGPFGRRILDIDYDVYAEGEAELGWLNSAVRVKAATPFDLDALLLDVVATLRDEFQEAGTEVAHLKAIGLRDLSFGVANLVSSGNDPELSLSAKGNVTEAEVIVNARVAADPAMLEEQVRRSLPEVCREHNATVEFQSMQSFRPGRPQPTHRYAVAK
jgi:Ni2+-binding GTPase involved in maturation of urease and hydrogenase